MCPKVLSKKCDNYDSGYNIGIKYILVHNTAGIKFLEMQMGCKL